ncbi:hypothetical protein KIH74_21655 [Kineosporia sp. J2-2]|uniref:Alpha/beta hydrolase family protein n=1 Tax=Kineosporia corallincola TaxID=2835133 RepID=A0ABS5TKD0_9ACTN|nr:hypothetical protein [Kineosporia corallincola]MBT0771559.1 hypothetical protein [Kineosporia corallincola]
MVMGYSFGPKSRWDVPLRRLSRFDGSTFRPVDEGSITEPYVHVFIHGWQPGIEIQQRMLATADLVAALPAWDPRLIDPFGRTLSSYHVHLLKALTDLGDDHCVLHYSWVDESATDLDVMLAYRSRRATQVNGRRLAMALQQAIRGREAHLHLIGHSHGSAVAAHAATALDEPPRQITLLDAPESMLSRLSGAANLMDVVLPRIRPGRTAERPFVDSYASYFGRPYHRKPGLSDVVDVSLYAGMHFRTTLLETVSGAHQYAVDWYTLSVREPERGVGYGWSPLYQAQTEGLAASYHSRRPKRPLSLNRRPTFLLPAKPQWMAARANRRSRITESEMHLSERSPAAARVLHLVPGDGLIEFDIEVSGGDGTEQIHLDLDAVPVFVAQARHPVPRSGRYVVLADGSAGQHLLTARLVTDRQAAWPRGEGDGPPRASITNVTVVSWPDAVPGFTFERVAMTTFVSGVVAGGAGTLAAQGGVRLARWGLRRLPALLARP